MSYARRDLAHPEHWERSLARARRKREIIPIVRRRQNRRRRASTALSALMVAGPAGQILGGLAAVGASAGTGPRTTHSRASDLPAGTLFRRGSRGVAVRAIQQRLGVAVDGIYGARTASAVRDFQARTGLLADGIVGPATWTQLMGLGEAALKAGAAGGDVAVIVRRRPAAGATRHLPTAGSPAAPAARRGRAPAERPVSERSAAAPRPAAVPVADREATPPPTPATESSPAGRGECGGALRLTMPVAGVRTSGFGPRGGRNHDGIDIAAPTGTPIRAAECGVVTFSGSQDGYGNLVCVAHSSELETCYAHMSRRAVSDGRQVKRGELLGYVGSTGNSTGPHLHFETRVNGRARNPEPYLRGGALPGRPRAAGHVQAGPAGATAARATAIGGAGVTVSRAEATPASAGSGSRPAAVRARAAVSVPTGAPTQAAVPATDTAQSASAPTAGPAVQPAAPPAPPANAAPAASAARAVPAAAAPPANQAAAPTAAPAAAEQPAAQTAAPPAQPHGPQAAESLAPQAAPGPNPQAPPAPGEATPSPAPTGG